VEGVLSLDLAGRLIADSLGFTKRHYEALLPAQIPNG
jgi:hypothetical protein